MHTVVKRIAVINKHIAFKRRAAEFKAIAVAVGSHICILVSFEGTFKDIGIFIVAFLLGVFEEAVFKCDAVIHINRADYTRIVLAVQVPTIVRIAVRYASVEHIVITYRKFCGEAIGIFALGFVVVVIVRRAISDEVIIRPCIYGTVRRIISTELQSRVAVVVKLAVFNDIIVAADIQTVVASAADIYAAPIIVIAVDVNAAVCRTE